MYYRGKQLSVVGRQLITNSHPEFYCYAESHDGIRWAKPDLGIVEFKDRRRTTSSGTEWDPQLLAVSRQAARCPADQKYKALGGTMREGGLFAFASPDGIRWRLLRKKPVIPRSIRFPEPGILG
ncbi:MAG: hypothetical protein CM1200mP2_46240 [Planctomycetaceae bacterium]|nr:MAG: hypothetical protein CM1200mP2_46240 [Planctomycetaceae bacterium]